MLELGTLAGRLLTAAERSTISRIAANRQTLYREMVLFDMNLGGAGIYNVNQGKTGRYDGRDREVYRPFQYIYSYLSGDLDQVDWLTREIVHMCGLHLESLLKRISLVHKLPRTLQRLPLGSLLGQDRLRALIRQTDLADMRVISALYNESKHRLDHEKDTHLFSVEATLLCYVMTRKLSIRVSPIAKLYTSPTTWEGVDMPALHALGIEYHAGTRQRLSTDEPTGGEDNGCSRI